MNNSSDSKLLSKEEITQLIDLWKQSGKSKKSFTDEYGIKYMTFIDWCRKRDGKKNKTKSNSEKFIPLQIKQDPAIFAELHLNSGQKVVFYQVVPAEYFQSFFK